MGETSKGLTIDQIGQTYIDFITLHLQNLPKSNIRSLLNILAVFYSTKDEEFNSFCDQYHIEGRREERRFVIVTIVELIYLGIILILIPENASFLVLAMFNIPAIVGFLFLVYKVFKQRMEDYFWVRNHIWTKYFYHKNLHLSVNLTSKRLYILVNSFIQNFERQHTRTDIVKIYVDALRGTPSLSDDGLERAYKSNSEWYGRSFLLYDLLLIIEAKYSNLERAKIYEKSSLNQYDFNDLMIFFFEKMGIKVKEMEIIDHLEFFVKANFPYQDGF